MGIDFNKLWSDRDEEIQAVTDNRRTRWFWCEQLKDLPKPVWLVDAMFHNKGVAVLYGDSGTYKSFLALDLCLSVATGRKFLNEYDTKQGAAAYFVAEGFCGLNERVEAWQAHYDTKPEPHTLLVVDAIYHLIDKGEADLVIANLEEMFGDTRPAVIVVDTLQKYHGGDTNTDDMSRFTNNCEKIAKHFECLVLIVHHQGKDSAKGMKGNSALEQGVDVIYYCEKQATGIGVSLYNEKQKNVAGGYIVKSKGSKVGNSLVFHFDRRWKDEAERTRENSKEKPTEWSGEQKVAYIALNCLPKESETVGKTLAELFHEHQGVFEEMGIHTKESLKTTLQRFPDYLTLRASSGQPTLYYSKL